MSVAIVPSITGASSGCTTQGPVTTTATTGTGTGLTLNAYVSASQDVDINAGNNTYLNSYGDIFLNPGGTSTGATGWEFLPTNAPTTHTQLAAPNQTANTTYNFPCASGICTVGTILTGSGAPGSSCTLTGQMYVDATNHIMYVCTGSNYTEYLPSPIRAGSWSISASTTTTVTFSPAMTTTPSSCQVTPSASSATTGQPFATTLSTTGFTVNVPTSGTINGTYLCVVNNSN